MNTLENDIIRSPNNTDEECGKFIIDETSRPFILHDIAQAGEQYTFSAWIKSSSSGSISIGGQTFNLTTEWTKCFSTFFPDSEDVEICFMAAGEYYFYHSKLEIGNKATDWTPAPEDIDSSINAVDSKFASYSTTAQMNSAIALAKDEISLSVSETYATIGNVAGIETRVSDAEALISVHSNEIALTVRQDGVISAINQSAEEVKIQAEKITLAGATIADEFTATNLHITGGSTFDGALNGATGTFSGELNAATGAFSGRVLITNYSSYRPALYFYNNKSTGYNLDGLTITSYIEDNGSDTLYISPPNPPNGYAYVIGNLETEKIINAGGRITSSSDIYANGSQKVVHDGRFKTSTQSITTDHYGQATLTTPSDFGYARGIHSAVYDYGVFWLSGLNIRAYKIASSENPTLARDVTFNVSLDYVTK